MKNLTLFSIASEHPRAVVAVAALLLISSCGLQQPVREDRSSRNIVPKSAPTPQNLPNVELSGNLLFDILVAEFAESSGVHSLADKKYLNSALTTRDPRLAKKATQTAILSKNHDRALVAANLWVEIEPENFSAHQSVASLLLLQGALKEAKPHLVWLLEEDNYSAKRLLVIANLMTGTTGDADVVTFFEEITSASGRSTEQITATFYATAVLAQKRGQIMSALDRLNRLLTDDPAHVNGLLLRSKLWYAQGNKADAIESLASFLEDHPDNLKVRLRYARMLIDTRDFEKGLVQFRILVNQAPDNADVIYGYGILAIQHNQLDVAEEQFQNLLRLKQREAEARQSLGLIFELRNQTDKAISWYHSVPRGKKFFASQLRAAQLIAKRDGFPSARSYLHQIPAANRAEEIKKLVAEAELLERDQQYDEAFKLLTIALKEVPNNNTLRYARAMAAEKIGRIDILEQDLTRVLAADPKNIQALNSLGYTLVDRTGRIAEGFEYIQRAYALDSKDPAILDSMGWAFYRMGRHQEALNYLRQASNHQQDGEIFAHLGEVLWVSGDPDGARSVWNSALKFDPKHPVLLKTLKRFVP